MKVVTIEKAFLLTESEQAILSKILRKSWQGLYVQGGKIVGTHLTERGVYSISSLIVLADEWLHLAAESGDFYNSVELFRIGIRTGQSVLADMSSKITRPSYSELVECPNDLNIRSFLGASPKVTLLRTQVKIPDTANRKLPEILIDSGILIEHSDETLLLYVDLSIPLNLCVTTSKIIIDKYLSKIVNKIVL
jgi:hypothetical protein